MTAPFAKVTCPKSKTTEVALSRHHGISARSVSTLARSNSPTMVTRHVWLRISAVDVTTRLLLDFEALEQTTTAPRFHQKAGLRART